MIEKEIQVQTTDGAMTTFAVHPDGQGPFPVALIYMDGIGYREQVKKNARRFAADGYYCVAPDLFYRSGTGLTFDMAKLAADGFKGPEAERLMSAVATVTPERVVADTEAALAAVETDPAAGSGPKVCVGYCMGARVALRVASALPDEFVAAAGIHPGVLVTDQPDSPHHDLPSVRAELYFAFAETDQSATPESIDRFRDALETNGIKGNRRTAARNRPRIRDGRPPRLQPRRSRTTLPKHTRALAQKPQPTTRRSLTRSVAKLLLACVRNSVQAVDTAPRIVASRENGRP